MLDERTTGEALLRLRELSGMSERTAARSIGVRTSVLRAWETRRDAPDADQIARAIAVYGRDLGDAIAPRTPLTDAGRPGVLIVGEEEIIVADHLGAGAGSHDRNAEVLCIYLAVVRRQRGLAAADLVELRSEDLAALAAELDLADSQLQQLLADLLGLTPAGAQLTVRTLLVGALVALVASGVVQGSWLAPTASASTSMVPSVRSEQVQQHRPGFWAGELGPTARGPIFAGTAADGSSHAEAERTAPPELFGSAAEFTTAAGRHMMFSVEPSVQIDTALAIEREIVDRSARVQSAREHSELFSVTPRGISR